MGFRIRPKIINGTLKIIINFLIVVNDYNKCTCTKSTIDSSKVYNVLIKVKRHLTTLLS